MKMRTILLSIAIAFSGIMQAAEHHVYQQELAVLLQKTGLQRILDTKLNGISRKIELNIHNYKRIPSTWQRLGLVFVLTNNVLCVNAEDMPELHSFVEELAAKSGIPTPYIFITLTPGSLNLFASKITNPGAIVIDQMAINKLSDDQLKAFIAHEIGHIKNNHTHKRLALWLSTLGISCYFLGDVARALAEYSVKKGNAFIKRQSVIFENQYRIMGAALIAKLVDGLIIGKRFEKQADQFAFEAGYAEPIMGAFAALQEERDILENDLTATREIIAAQQGSLAPENIQILTQELDHLEGQYRLSKWIHEKTPFEQHPTNADRIADAQAYLDAQVQVPALEKA